MILCLFIYMITAFFGDWKRINREKWTFLKVPPLSSQCKRLQIRVFENDDAISVYSMCLEWFRLKASAKKHINSRVHGSVVALMIHQQNFDLLQITTNSRDMSYTHNKFYTHTSADMPSTAHCHFPTSTVY